MIAVLFKVTKITLAMIILHAEMLHTLFMKNNKNKLKFEKIKLKY